MYPKFPLILPTWRVSSRLKCSPTQLASTGSPAAVPIKNVSQRVNTNVSLSRPVACSSTKSTSCGLFPVPWKAICMALACADATGALTGATDPVDVTPVPKIW